MRCWVLIMFAIQGGKSMFTYMHAQWLAGVVRVQTLSDSKDGKRPL